MTTKRTDAVIELYWRPGCAACVVLRALVRYRRLPVREVNIWDDPEAAARVRSVANGSETVPTVFVGMHPLVNPAIGELLAAVRQQAPDVAAAVEAEAGARQWRPAAGAILFALLWGLLAFRTPTTYHLAPLVVAAVPGARRRLAHAPVRSREALMAGVAGLAIALLATAGLAWRGRLAGSDLTGGDQAVVEAVLLAGFGAMLGWWLSPRDGRERPASAATRAKGDRACG
jgi:glutaredoxin